MRIGIDIRVADPSSPGQQRYLWRLGGWLASQQHDVSFLTVRPQSEVMTLPPGTTLHSLAGLAGAELRSRVAAMSVDALLLNPERSRSYRGIRANVLRAAYGTDHYRQKLRSFTGPVESAIRKLVRLSPWELAERRWEREFYHPPGECPEIIAQSQYMKREIIDTYGVPDERVHVIHNAVDTSVFNPEAVGARRAGARERWGIPADAFCLLFVGHNYRLKGLWRILDVLSGTGPEQSPHLLVLGRGTGTAQRAEAASRIRGRGLERRVIMAGAADSVLDAYAAADALLHITWHDSFGFVVLEAMACGLPVITTRYAGASELIEHARSGFLVDPADASDLTAAISQLADRSTRARMGTTAAEIGRASHEVKNFAAVLRVFEIAAERSSGTVR
jgi:glycosyltransferase involved in cell wall biosynthesis